MNTTNVFMAAGSIIKTGTLVMNFYKTAGKANPYVRFGYGPLAIFHHIQEQFLGSMNTDTINMIHTSKQSTKEVLNKELEGDFISSTIKLQMKIIDE